MPGAASAPPRRVVVFALGGTIAMTATSGGGVVPALSAEQLVAAVPGLAETGIHVETRDFRSVPGASLTFEDLDELDSAVRADLDTGADGVVVMQGTDTIEETAYRLDLTHTRPEPLVVTGAMRHPTLAGADGPANLLAAILTAANPELRGRGVLVVLADEIHAAARVRKSHSTSGHTFVSATGGPLGYLVEGLPRLVSYAAWRTTVAAVGPPHPADVALITVVFDDRGTLLRPAADAADGLVVAGFGVGHVPVRIVDTLAEIAESVPVVLASRTGAGPVLTSTYGFAGSESDLIAKRLVPAGFLDPLKARILLRQLLVGGHDRSGIRAAFAVANGLDAAEPETHDDLQRNGAHA